MATINAMLDSIVQLLVAQPNCDIAIENFPDRWEDYYLTHPVGAVLIQFGGESDNQSDDAGVVIQERRLRFGMTLLFRNLNGHDGVYEYLDKLRVWLTGFQPIDCERMVQISSKFVAQNDGLWTYFAEFGCKSSNVQMAPPDNAPPLTQVTYEESA